ncbi:MAG: hypothetical protein K1060chlam5_00388 [Candidatus Anoxychlamydiales bacterium]|nr:hypothetical protein [Candidatus Anoxychlamydiales bacterium]
MTSLATYNQNSDPSVSNQEKNNKLMLELLWSDIESNSGIKELQKSHYNIKDTDPRKVCYSFIVMMIMDKVGIDQTSQLLKAIAAVEKLINKVVGDLAKLENLLSELAELRGTVTKKNPKGKASKNDINTWLNKKGSDGLTNGQELQKVWKDLFGGGSHSLMSQLKNALNNPFYKQTVGTSYNTTLDLNGKGSPFAKKDWTSGGKSFLDFLKGDNSVDVGAILYKVYDDTFNHNTTTSGKSNTYIDDIGNGKNTMETAKQLQNSMSTQESTDMSMYSQNLTSFIQIAQQIIQTAQKEISQMVAQQGGR